MPITSLASTIWMRRKTWKTTKVCKKPTQACSHNRTWASKLVLHEWLCTNSCTLAKSPTTTLNGLASWEPCKRSQWWCPNLRSSTCSTTSQAISNHCLRCSLWLNRLSKARNNRHSMRDSGALQRLQWGPTEVKLTTPSPNLCSSSSS